MPKTRALPFVATLGRRSQLHKPLLKNKAPSPQAAAAHAFTAEGSPPPGQVGSAPPDSAGVERPPKA
jgi:hypothetical protein